MVSFYQSVLDCQEAFSEPTYGGFAGVHPICTRLRASPRLIVAAGPPRDDHSGPVAARLPRYRDHGRREAVGVERAPVGIASRARRTEVGRAEVGRGGRRS